MPDSSKELREKLENLAVNVYHKSASIQRDVDRVEALIALAVQEAVVEVRQLQTYKMVEAGDKLVELAEVLDILATLTNNKKGTE